MKDIITEHAFGKEAVEVIGKLVMFNQAPTKIKDPTDPEGKRFVDLEKTVVGGLVIGNLTTPLPEKSSVDEQLDLALEMWEVQMIIKPRRKYRGTAEGHESFGGMRIDQILSSDWGSKKRYKYQIFPLIK